MTSPDSQGVPEARLSLLPPLPIVPVRQEDEWGCGLAALAMLTGDTYAEVKANIEADPWANDAIAYDWTVSGITQVHVEKYLADRGLWFRRVYSSWQCDGIWPPPPFARAHYCQVTQPSGNGHFVVMDWQGVVFDPMDPTGRHSLSDWAACSYVVGVVRVEIGGRDV